ncbi:hypothetical protein ACQ859_11305 [Roseateles chitinivorans]|uniref:hypothetical protein n=1 Tax=Roseateles chitinivorans TaxID=2917965 RepID=UPI003D679FDE
MRVDKMLTTALGAAALLPPEVSAGQQRPSNQVSPNSANGAFPSNSRVSMSGGTQPGRVSLPPLGQPGAAAANRPAQAAASSSETFNTAAGGRAAAAFQRDFAQRLQGAPMGSVLASREALGLKPHDFAMVDIGGEGQKTAPDGMKSGNLHAINVNAQSTISSGPMKLQTAPGESGPGRDVNGGPIPNLVRIGEWPSPGKASAEGFVPLAKGFSNLTTMEGAPVHAYHVAELDRVTSSKGWIALTVDESFKPQIDQLAQARNGGDVWHLSKASPTDNDRYIVPPAGLSAEESKAFKAKFEAAGPHEIHDVAQAVSLQLAAKAGRASHDEL